MQIMWDCITMSKQPDGYPPQILEKKRKPDGTWHIIWSYGVELMNDAKYKHIDRDLRLLIANCMSDDPTERPSANTINSLLAQKLTTLDLSQPDAETDAFCRDLFGIPGP